MYDTLNINIREATFAESYAAMDKLAAEDGYLTKSRAEEDGDMEWNPQRMGYVMLRRVYKKMVDGRWHYLQVVATNDYAAHRNREREIINLIQLD